MNKVTTTLVVADEGNRFEVRARIESGSVEITVVDDRGDEIDRWFSYTVPTVRDLDEMCRAALRDYTDGAEAYARIAWDVQEEGRAVNTHPEDDRKLAEAFARRVEFAWPPVPGSYDEFTARWF